MARPLPWYPHYIEDFRRGTRGMTHEARSCYRELLDVQWEHGSIPSDLPTLARILGIPLARTRKVWEQIGEKFAPVSGTSKRLANERMAEERRKLLEAVEIRPVIKNNPCRYAYPPLERCSWDTTFYDNAYKRDGHRCRYCGSTDIDATIDHVLPRSQGGGDELSNLVVACRSCNSRKGGRTPEQAGMPLRPAPECN